MHNDAELNNLLKASLDSFKDPETGRPVSKTNQVTDWQISNGHVKCRLLLTTHSQPIAQEVADALRDHFLAQSPSISGIDISLGTLQRPPASIGQIGLKVKSVIAVGAGKGGVGKSTLSASLAIMLERLGAKVGLMDADVYGPSIPHLLGLSGRPEIHDGKIQPIMSGTMPVMSMASWLNGIKQSCGVAPCYMARSSSFYETPRGVNSTT